MLQHLRPALVMLALFTLLTGLAYPFALLGIAAALPGPANGSLVKKGDVVVGSRLIGQNFTKDGYFHSRPSATSATDPNDATKTIDAPYNADNSSGSNLGPTSAKLVDRVKGDIEALRKSDGLVGPVPGDAVTTSGSGLDPDISPAYAKAQVARVAKARNLAETQVAALVDANTAGRLLGILGESRVNVLELNLALDGNGAK
jgi:potassium-transporting ATPase KdpC subunit